MYNMQHKVFTNKTGRFPTTSSRGKKYIMIAYEMDSNLIHAKPLKTRKSTKKPAAYKSVNEMLTVKGLKPKIHILDNECSETFTKYMKHVQENYQFVLPHIHRRNATKRSIQTFKNHFIAGLSSINKLFPMNLWFRLLPQALLTLNLLRGSRINPKLSAYARVHRAYNFNVTPLAPTQN